jgi:glutamate carboxypeptidase
VIESLAASAHAHRDWAMALIEDLVGIESPSTDAAALARCRDDLSRRLEGLGLRVRTVPGTGGSEHLRAEAGTGDSQLLILGHFDTVWPIGQLDRMPIRRDGNRLFGPGAYDMKGGIAVAMLAIRALADTGATPGHRIVMLWTCDEEIGSAGSRALIEDEARLSRAVLVLEPALAGGGVKTARKGVGDFVVSAHGISAHAGVEPGRGASAIHEMVWQSQRLLELEDRDRGLTVNLGRIAGGSRPNVVADEASVEVDVRIPTLDDAHRVAAAMAGLTARDPRVRLTVAGGINRPPMERTPGVAQLYERAAALAGALGHDLPEGATGGASDGNFTAALGIPTLDGLGPDGAGAHALHEHVDLDSVPFRAALVAGLALDLP